VRGRPQAKLSNAESKKRPAVARLPAAAAQSARGSVAAAMAIARHAPGTAAPALTRSVSTSFMTGFTVACLAGAAICALGALAATRLPGRPATVTAPGPASQASTTPAATRQAPAAPGPGRPPGSRPARPPRPEPSAGQARHHHHGDKPAMATRNRHAAGRPEESQATKGERRWNCPGRLARRWNQEPDTW
jgi:hypothetical protein